MLYNNRNRYYIWTYAVLFLLSFSVCNCHISTPQKYITLHNKI